jgi:hypothetical protein
MSGSEPIPEALGGSSARLTSAATGPHRPQRGRLAPPQGVYEPTDPFSQPGPERPGSAEGEDVPDEDAQDDDKRPIHDDLDDVHALDLPDARGRLSRPEPRMTPGRLWRGMA